MFAGEGVLERLITHLSDGSLHVCGLGGLPLVEFPCDVRVDVWLVEGVGGLGVAGALEGLEVVEDPGEILDGTFGWPLKLLLLWLVLSKRGLCQVIL